MSMGYSVVNYVKGRSELPQPSTMCKRSVPVVLGSEDSYYTDYEVLQGVPRDPAKIGHYEKEKISIIEL